MTLCTNAYFQDFFDSLLFHTVTILIVFFHLEKIYLFSLVVIDCLYK